MLLQVSQAICSVQSVIEYLELQLGSHPDALMLSDKRLMLHVRYFLVKLFLQAVSSLTCSLGDKLLCSCLYIA